MADMANVVVTQIPPAGFIEAGKDALGNVPEQTAADQRKELHMAVPDASEDFIKGYELGLSVARVMIRTNAAAILAGVEEKIL